MKTSETKTSANTVTHAKNTVSPFFSKEGQGGTSFFGGETMAAKSFFSPRTIQPKLTIGKPNDVYEQQADSVADQVVAKLNAPQTPSVPPTLKGSPTIQPKCAACEKEEKLQKKEEDLVSVGEQVQMKPIFESAAEPSPDDTVQRKCAECEKEETVQRKTDGNTEGAASPDLSSRLSASKGGGQPLPADTRTSMESAMGADFSNVRVHTGSEAVQMSQGINAQAFTHGSDVYFNEGKFNPSHTEGAHLLAHELTHTVQQGAASSKKIQRVVCPQTREPDENTQSQSAEGVLPENSVFLASDNKLIIQDFAINSATLPGGVSGTEPWQRAMSMILGDPSALLAVEGFTDCNGSMRENLSLRNSRVGAVVSAMPAAAQAKILLRGAWSAATYLASNDTAVNRAKNRAVVITFRSALGPRGVDSCDMLHAATDMDQYLFLVRCAENRLGLTTTSSAPTTLSVLRQLYYGSANWANNPNSVWDDVVTGRPWSPGRSPETQLGSTLFNALKASQVVSNNGANVDIGHLLSGLDASRNVDEVSANVGSFHGIQASIVTNVLNQAWATWAGDVGSAAAEYAFEVNFLNIPDTYDHYYEQYASDADMLGNLDSFSIWTASNIQQGTQTGQELQNLVLNAPVSEVLMRYYRLTQTTEGRLHDRQIQNFIQSYGGVVTGRQITNRPQFEARLLPQTQEFATLFFINLVRNALQTAQPSGSSGSSGASGTPPRTVSIGSMLSDVVVASQAMTTRFVSWLIARL